MPQGDKDAYTDKQKGVTKEEAERRAWATVNKQDGGGKKSGGGRKKSDSK